MEMKKKAVTLLLTGMMILSVLNGCGNAQQASVESDRQDNAVQTVSANVTSKAGSAADTKTQEAENTVPKYIFLFIGDGMSYPQIQLTNYYQNAASGNDSVTVDGEEVSKEVFNTSTYRASSAIYEVGTSSSNANAVAAIKAALATKDLATIKAAAAAWSDEALAAQQPQEPATPDPGAAESGTTP